MSATALIAGLVSTVIFAGSMLPMIVKAVSTRDLQSYSLGNLVLINSGNAVHSLYVFSLPAGPIWVLHSFHLTTSVIMLVWYLRFADRTTRRSNSCPPPPTPDRSRPSSSAPARPVSRRRTTSPARVTAVSYSTPTTASATPGVTSTIP